MRVLPLVLSFAALAPLAAAGHWEEPMNFAEWGWFFPEPRLEQDDFGGVGYGAHDGWIEIECLDFVGLAVAELRVGDETIARLACVNDAGTEPVDLPTLDPAHRLEFLAYGDSGAVIVRLFGHPEWD